MRRIAWVVGGVVAVCFGISAVWGVDYLLVTHGWLGNSDNGPAPTTPQGKVPQHAMTTGSLIANIAFFVIFIAIVVTGGYLLAKRRTARDAARRPGEEDDYGILGGLRRRRMGERTFDPIGGAQSTAPPILAEPADPRQLPGDIEREANELRANNHLDPRG